jgi:hypothetical protein
MKPTIIDDDRNKIRHLIVLAILFSESYTDQL